MTGLFWPRGPLQRWSEECLLRKVHPRSNRGNRSVLSFGSTQPGSAATAPPPPPPARGSTPPGHALQASFPAVYLPAATGARHRQALPQRSPSIARERARDGRGKGELLRHQRAGRPWWRRLRQLLRSMSRGGAKKKKKKKKRVPLTLALPSQPRLHAVPRGHSFSFFSCNSCCAADAGALLLPSPGAKCEKSCKGDGVCGERTGRGGGKRRRRRRRRKSSRRRACAVCQPIATQSELLSCTSGGSLWTQRRAVGWEEAAAPMPASQPAERAAFLEFTPA